METKNSFDIDIVTLPMQPPIIIEGKTIKRQSKIITENVDNFLSFETFLRRTAYENTTIKTDQSFFDDSDMKSEYYLVVVYEKISNIPLLSSRHYFDKTVISKYLKGDDEMEVDLKYNGEKFNIDNYKDGQLFLADRLSGNKTNPIYPMHRKTILLKYYAEIVVNNENCTLLLMVRKEKYDLQLSKYLNMGFSIIGSTIHKGNEHTIIIRDLVNISSND